MTSKLIIFTDLDGSLLDHETYSCEQAAPALSQIRDKNIPLIFCTSKTKDETLHIQNVLGIRSPFIVENGGGVFIPKGYFSLDIHPTRSSQHFDIFDIGTSYPHLTDFLCEFAHETGYPIKGFASMDTAEIADLTGLDIDRARLVQYRSYDEPFIIDGPDRQIIDELSRKASVRGFTVTQGGRFHHITGGNDKGKAVALLIDFFKKQYADIFTIALGDGINDLPMLRIADKAVLVRSRHTAPDISTIHGCIATEQYGPEGWNTAVRALLMLYSTDA
ncbi:MAG: HAD-IIB family hydrolase [Spirochaetota bacterium]